MTRQLYALVGVFSAGSRTPWQVELGKVPHAGWLGFSVSGRGGVVGGSLRRMFFGASAAVVQRRMAEGARRVAIACVAAAGTVRAMNPTLNLALRSDR